jgi:hypothetical protein
MHILAQTARVAGFAALSRLAFGGLKPTLRVLAVLLPWAAAFAQGPASEGLTLKPRIALVPWASLDDQTRKPAARSGYDLRLPSGQPGLEDILVYDRRPPRPTDLPGLLEPAPSVRSMFNVRGEAMARPENCQAGYTTVGGQPAIGADIAGPVGISGCYW